MKTLILTLAIFSSIFTFSQNLRSQEEIKFFNKEFIRLINIERKKLNLDTLIESEELSNKSMSWSRECVTFSKFEHADIKHRGNTYECLAEGSGCYSIQRAVIKRISLFKSSEDHWKILMDHTVKYIGVGEYMNYDYSTRYTNSEGLSGYLKRAICTVRLY
jgi:uncharacterized protein YkwD